MPLDCGATFAKYLLCLFNFAFFWAGTAVLAVGIWLAVDQTSLLVLLKFTQTENVLNLLEPLVLRQAAYLLIAAGTFVFIVSFLGYCGAIKESRVLLALYGCFVLIIVALEITAGSLAASYHPEAEKEIKGVLLTSLRDHYSTPQQSNAYTVSWNLLQGKLKCCGVRDYGDFEEARQWRGNKSSSQLIPVSCCKLSGDFIDFQPEYKDCTNWPNPTNSYLNRGCYRAMVDYLTENLEMVVGIGVGLGVSQLLGVIFAFCLCHAIANDYIK